MARESDIHGFAATLITIPSNNSVLIPEEAKQVAGTLKYFSGGSLEIVGVTAGTTLTGTSLMGTGYLMGTSEVFNYAGPARYYITSTGATTLAYFLKGFGPGY